MSSTAANRHDALTSRCLRAFPQWLDTLATDALGLHAVSEDAPCPLELQEACRGALLALRRGLRIIPQEIADVGYLELAMLVRTAVSVGLDDAGQQAQDAPGADLLRRLAKDDQLLRELLGRDHSRLEKRARSWVREARAEHAEGASTASGQAGLVPSDARAQARAGEAAHEGRGGDAQALEDSENATSDEAPVGTESEGRDDSSAASLATAAPSKPSPPEDAWRELQAWASRYSAPHFAADEKNLVKLQAFLLARMPG